MDLDTGLLQRDSGKGEQDGSAERVSRLREAQRDAAEPEEDGEPQSLREAVIAAKKQREAKEAKEEGGAVAALATPMRKATSRLLRQAWLNLIDSWGATFIWINIHAFLHVILGDKFFCKLGAEWADALPIPEEAKNSGAAEQGKKVAETVEKMGVGCIDAGCCAVIFLILAVISLIVAIFTGNPLEVIKNIFSILWCAIGGC